MAHAPKRKIKNISSIKSLMTSLILQETYTISLWVKECLNMMPSILLDNKHEGLTCCSKLLDLNFRLHTHTHTPHMDVRAGDIECLQCALKNVYVPMRNQFVKIYGSNF